MEPKTYIIINVLQGDLNRLFLYLHHKLHPKFAGQWENKLALFVPAGGAGYSMNELKQAISEVVDLADVCMGDLYPDGEVIIYDDI